MCDEIRLRTVARCAEQSQGFQRGQIASFTTKFGVTETITIDRINTKTISGTTSAGRQWRVSPSLLRAA